MNMYRPVCPGTGPEDLKGGWLDTVHGEGHCRRSRQLPLMGPIYNGVSGGMFSQKFLEI